MKTSLLFTVLFIVRTALSAQVLNLDPRFDTGSGTDGQIYAAVMQSDGKVIIAGTFNDYNSTTAYSIARLNIDGSIDGTFQANVGSTFQNSTIYDLGLDSNGEIYVVGDFIGYVKRINTDGTIDAFSLTGTGLDAIATALEVQADDKIIVGGLFETFDTSTDRDKIARINTDGTLDTGFDPGTGFNPGFYAPINDIEIQDDGKILVGGEFTTYNGVSNTYLVRLNSDGSEDNTFTTSTSGYVEDITIQTDNRIVVVGRNQVSANGRVIRMSADGTVDDIDKYYSSTLLSVSIKSSGEMFIGDYEGLKILDSSDGSDISSDYLSSGNFEGSPKINAVIFTTTNEVIAVGTFTSFNGLAVNNIARLNECNSLDITSESNNLSVCEGSDPAFTVTAVGGGLTYQWQKVEASGIYTNLTNGGMFTGTTTNALHLVDVTLSEDGYQFRCVISDGTCQLTSRNFSLDVLEQQVITSQPSDAMVCENENANFTVTFDGDFGEFQWQEDDGSGGGFVDLAADDVYSNVNGSTLTVSGVTAELDGNKYRLVMDLCNQVISSEVTLTVNDLPAIEEQPAGVYLCQSGDASYSVTVTGSNLTYQWQTSTTSSGFYSDLADNANYSGTTSSTLDITGIDSSLPELNSGELAYYRCVVSSDEGCTVTSAHAFLSIYPTPVITADPVDVNECDSGNGVNTSFTVTVDQNSGGYQWQVDDGSGNGFVDLVEGADTIHSNTTFATLNLTKATAPLNGYKYRVILEGCDPQIISAEATLTISNEPVTSLIQNRQVCEGTNASYYIESDDNNLQFQWQLVNGATYTDLTDDATYLGTTTDSLVITTSMALDGADYRCVITTGACEHIVNVTPLDVIPQPSFTAGAPDRTACIDESVTFAPGTPTNYNSSVHSYQWQESIGDLGLWFDIDDDETYSGTTTKTLTVTPGSEALDRNQYRLTVKGCELPIESPAATLTVNTSPFIVNSTVGLQTICEGASATFGVQAVGSDLSYRWYYATENGGPFNSFGDNNYFQGSTADTLRVSNTPFDFGGYTFYCIVSGTCTPSDTTPGAQLTVNHVTIDNDGFVLLDGATTSNTMRCAGEDLIMSVQATGPSLTYQWRLNGTDLTDGGTVSGATTSELTISGLAVENAGIYTCIVGGICEGKESIPLSVNVTFIAKPEITMGADFLTVNNVFGDTFEWYRDGNLFENTGSYTLNDPPPGSYTVIAFGQGCASEESDAVVVEVLGLSPVADLNIYPNPVLRNINFDLPSSIRSGLRFRIVDLSGKQHLSGVLQPIIDVHDLPSGVYMLIFQDDDNKTSLKFVKN